MLFMLSAASSYPQGGKVHRQWGGWIARHCLDDGGSRDVLKRCAVFILSDINLSTGRIPAVPSCGR